MNIFTPQCVSAEKSFLLSSEVAGSDLIWRITMIWRRWTASVEIHQGYQLVCEMTLGNSLAGTCDEFLQESAARRFLNAYLNNRLN